MGASEKIYPSGGVLHQGEGPSRRRFYTKQAKRVSTRHRITLAEAEAHDVKSWVSANFTFLYAWSRCPSRIPTRVVGGETHDGDGADLHQTTSKPSQGWPLKDPMGVLVKESHKEATPAAREEDCDP